MNFFELSSVLIALAALFSFLNFKYLRLPTTIGIMLMALIVSLVLIVLGGSGLGIREIAAHIIAGVDFQHLVLHVMLAFLLFAGSLHLDMSQLRAQWTPIAALALIGTALSTLIVALLIHFALGAIGIALPWLYSLLFGALISPTDPIAVLAIMRSVAAPADLQTLLAGESIFNDGVGVVFFLSLLDLTTGATGPNWTQAALHLLASMVGGVAVGLAAGILVYQMVKRVDQYHVEILLTLALAMGSFTLAEAIHVSAPIAAAVAGLFMGNHGRSFGMSATTQEYLDTFWELIDEILNALLFMLIGLEVLTIDFSLRLLLAGVLAIAIVLLSRWLSVWGMLSMFRWRVFQRGSTAVLVWGGLRGGLSFAMALSIPVVQFRNPIAVMTYCVVAFSIVVQGLSIREVIKRALRENTLTPLKSEETENVRSQV